MFSEKFLAKNKNTLIILSAALLVLDFLVYARVFALLHVSRDLKIYFLDVGQGDSELIILPGLPAQAGGVKVLIDGGPPNGQLLEDLGKILPPTDRYIDLVMASHPQLDHFGGFIEVLKRYRVGAFLWNGREGTASAWPELKKVVAENSIRTIILAASDKILYGKNRFEILSPPPEFLSSKELNDTTLVTELLSNNSKSLFTGDIGFKVEDYLVKNSIGEMDILKVPHHGSKTSSGAGFLAALKPKIAAIEVGKNTYGHPTKETLGRLENIGAKIFRTDQNGTIKILIDGKKISIFSDKN